MPRKKNVVMEVPAALEETVRRLMKLEERNERMAKGEEPVNWRSLSGELEAAMRDGEAQVARRWLQSYDERRKAITVDGMRDRLAKPLKSVRGGRAPVLACVAHALGAGFWSAPRWRRCA